MVGHQAIGQQTHRLELVCLAQHLLKGVEIAFFAEQSHTADGPIEYMINIAAAREAQSPRHVGS